MQFIWQHRQLIKKLVERDIHSRYKSTFLGIFWVVMTPLLMLSVYTFVFSSILKARWPSSSDNEFEFAIVLFCGLIIFNLLSEVLVRAPELIVNNVNYVKKVIFPVEILPIVSLGSALFQTFINFIILLVFYLIYFGFLHWTLILIPLVLLPFVILLAGLGLLLASLGVFIRDIGQVIGIVTTGMMFLSPIFYPLSALSEHIRPYLYLNPLTFIIEQMREVVIWGHLPYWPGLLIYTLLSLVVAWMGYFFFIKTRKGFADVL
jgi:lipopolysaccharide transport system permease protein